MADPVTKVRVIEVEQCCYSYTSPDFFQQFKTLDEVWAAIQEDHAKRKVEYPNRWCGCKIREVDSTNNPNWATGWIEVDPVSGVLIQGRSNWDSSD